MMPGHGASARGDFDGATEVNDRRAFVVAALAFLQTGAWEVDHGEANGAGRSKISRRFGEEM